MRRARGDSTRRRAFSTAAPAGAGRNRGSGRDDTGLLPSGKETVYLGMSIIAELRKLIHASGMSRNAIALKSGVSVGIVSRLLSGERPDLTTRTAEALAKAIGYELTFRPTGRGKRAKHGKSLD